MRYGALGIGHWALGIGHWVYLFSLSPISLISPLTKIYISARMMIKRVQKPDRFSYQRVKTGEDESPGYWW
ncbi:hypothetical protein [Nostoc sp.]|uniref:hypothetical protein n=1 Tax=Nostoc sp. TaxID=1180 RepID=UPI002FFB1A15